jgi:DNA-binding transcriptional regulator LsrR (DeoR family)
MDNNKKYCNKLKAAKYYYNENLTQQEIADRLYLSRPTVSKMLKEAKEEGIVQFKIVDIKNKCHMFELEEKLMNKFNLKNVIVAEYDDNYDNLKDKIGKAAASYFEDAVKSKMKIGISWGTTLKAMVQNLDFNSNVKDLEIVSMVGGSRNLLTDIQANILVENILNKYSGTGYFLYAPAVVDNEAIGENLKNNQETKEILQKAREVDIAFVGIGPEIEKSTLKKTGYFTEEEIKKLKEHHSVGDVCWRFFDKNGNAAIEEMDKRTIGISLEALKKMETVVGVAGGKEKIDSILASLKGGFLDVLITDENTARKVLDKGSE